MGPLSYIHGFEGLDELSTGGQNTICYYQRGEVEGFVLDPSGFGLRKAISSEIMGGSPQFNAGRMLDLFWGKTEVLYSILEYSTLLPRCSW